MKLNKGILFHNRYLLVSALGEGASADVWKAKDTKANDLTVALKIFSQHSELDTYGLRDFEREFTTVYNMKHSNLLPPTGYDICNGRPYLVMQYCENGSCSSMKERIGEEDLLKFLHDVSAGLEYLHDHNIIHQDIKPDNILLDDNCNFMVTDFGISVSADKNGLDSSNASGGTRDYMGPERFQGITVNASDIWSLGATAYELFTGYPPFGEHGGLLQAQGEKIPDMSELKLQPEVKDILKSCLAEDPSKRIKANEIRQKIELYWETGAWIRHSNKNVIAIALTAAASIILCLGIFLWDYNRTKVYYYKDYAEFKAVPKGIGRLSHNTMKHRSSSYKLEYRKFKLRRLSLVNSAGKVVKHSDTEYAVSRFPDVRYYYTDKGDVDYLTVYNEFGTLLFKMDYDENLKTATFRQNDEYGTEMNLDANTNTLNKGSENNLFTDKSRISRYQFSYDERGLLTERRYVGFQNVPACDANNIYGQRYTYDKKGRKIEEAYIGADGKITSDSNGLAFRVYEYDKNDNWISVEYLNVERKGSHDGNNCTIVKLEYDKYGNRIKESYYSYDGKPSIRTDFNISGLKYVYNEKGFRVSESTFGIDGSPAYNSHGFVTSRNSYDENGYSISQELLDENNEPVLSKDEAYSCLKTTVNDKGQNLELRCFDEYGLPCELSNGVHKYTYKYDKNGNLTEERYFDKEGNQTLVDGFYSGVICEYDEFNHTTKEYYIDEKGQLTTCDGIIACFNFEYNRQGAVTKVSFNGKNGNLVVADNMYAGYTYTYDEIGNKKSCQYFDAEGKPCSLNSGVSKTEYFYDSKTNFMTKESWYDVNSKVIKDFIYKYDSKGNTIESYTLKGDKLMPGTVVTKHSYDSNNRETSEWYCNLNGSKVRGTNVLYAQVKYEYDERGNCIEATFWDTDGSPATEEGKTHKRTREFNVMNQVISEKNYGKDGKPISGSDSNPEGRVKYDKWGNMVEISCFDGYGNPRLGSNGAFITKYEFDKRGNKIHEEYLGLKQELVILKGADYAKADFIHNSHGDITESNFYDTKKLIRSEKRKYNEKNQVVEECYYDENGKLNDKFYGVSKVTIEYENNGVIPIRKKYFNSSGEMLASEKYNKKTGEWGDIVYNENVTANLPWETLVHNDAQQCPQKISDECLIKSITKSNSNVTVTFKLTELSMYNLGDFDDTEFKAGLVEFKTEFRKRWNLPSNVTLTFNVVDKAERLMYSL